MCTLWKETLMMWALLHLYLTLLHCWMILPTEHLLSWTEGDLSWPVPHWPHSRTSGCALGGHWELGTGEYRMWPYQVTKDTIMPPRRRLASFLCACILWLQVQRQLDVDLLISGHTHKVQIQLWKPDWNHSIKYWCITVEAYVYSIQQRVLVNREQNRIEQ